MKKSAIGLVISLALIFSLTTCKDLKTENTEKEIDSVAEEIKDDIIGNYQYPENPAEQLRDALTSDISEYSLPLEVGDVDRIEFNGENYTQIKINFSDSSENMCVISFSNSDGDSLDGYDNPSFIMEFKDSDNSRDMVTVLTSVIKYLSSDLSFEEAERLATNQDETMGAEGYAMPQDIGGYQVQARYTNPYVFYQTPDFDAKLGVKVTALKQMWGTLDTEEYQEISSQDYDLLTTEYWDDSKQPEYVCANIVVKNVWQNQSYLHGETWQSIEVESMSNKQGSLFIYTMYPYVYQFGVGQSYTVYVCRQYPGKILYAVQCSESTKSNSRGETQPLEYSNEDWKNAVERIEPVGHGIVYNVIFQFQDRMMTDQVFAALEGYGIGEEQWQPDPGRDGYTFFGWYDNLLWEGEPYSKDTPIYQDTYLYAKWKYTGSGGVWPRAYRGDIQGIDEGGTLSAAESPTITANGYNMGLNAQDQRFRWMPVSWRLTDGTSGSFSSQAPYEATVSLNSKGEQCLYISYQEEIFDGLDWQETGQICEVEEVVFQVD